MLLVLVLVLVLVADDGTDGWCWGWWLGMVQTTGRWASTLRVGASSWGWYGRWETAGGGADVDVKTVGDGTNGRRHTLH